MIWKKPHTTLRYWLLTLLFVVGTAVSYGQQNKIRVQLNAPRVATQGAPFNISITVNDLAVKETPQLLLPDGLQILYGPEKSIQLSRPIINGSISVSTTVSFTYVLLANATGEYTLPAIGVKVGSATYKTAQQKISVVSGTNSKNTEAASPHNSGQADVFATVTASKKDAYENEGILVSYKLYSTERFDINSIRVPDFDGFVSQKVDLSKVRQISVEEHNGKAYNVVLLHQTLLYPQHAGSLQIPAGHFGIQVTVPVIPSFDDPDDLFRDFFSTQRTIQKNISTQPLTIHVKPLPKPAPEGFNGAVGQFKIEPTEKPQSITRADESYRISYTLQGWGNLNMIKLNLPQYPSSFNLFDPKEQVTTTITDGKLTGTKQVDFFVVPRSAGEYTLPGLTFCYFDPTSGKYEQLKTPEIPVHVDPAKEGASRASVADYSHQEKVKYTGQDIHYIKTTNGITPYKPSWTNWLLLYLLVLMAGIGSSVWILGRRSVAGQKAYNSKQASKRIRKWLRIAETERNNTHPEVYYEALLKGLNNFISHKFHLPVIRLNKEDIRHTLLSYGSSEELVSETINILTTLELNQYSPATNSEERDRLYDQVVSIIQQLDKLKIK